MLLPHLIVVVFGILSTAQEGIESRVSVQQFKYSGQRLAASFSKSGRLGLLTTQMLYVFQIDNIVAREESRLPNDLLMTGFVWTPQEELAIAANLCEVLVWDRKNKPKLVYSEKKALAAKLKATSNGYALRFNNLDAQVDGIAFLTRDFRYASFIQTPLPVDEYAVSGDGSLFAAILGDGSCSIRGSIDGVAVVKTIPLPGEAESLEFGVAEKEVCLVTRKLFLRVDVRTGKIKHAVSLDEYGYCFAFSPTKKQVAFCGINSQVVVCDAETLKARIRFQGLDFQPRAIQFLPDERGVVIAYSGSRAIVARWR